MDRNSTDSRGLVKFHSPLYLTPRTSLQATVNRPPPPHPRHTPTLLAPRPTLQGPNGQLSYLDTVTSGAMCSQGVIQRAAAMRVTRLATTSSDTKATIAVHQMSFVPPANSPFRSRSYANFVTDQELQQARAEMEECYRRRARRAGLEDSLPVGRPMMDEEIEDLQWQLGDFGPASGYGSRGKKRSQQEVIDMTIEEMEAEINETNEAIRKRRRRGPPCGCLPCSHAW
jgi:hypothetical protein